MGLVWMNAYLCRQDFFIQYTGQMLETIGCAKVAAKN
jgi:hypothetical protein